VVIFLETEGSSPAVLGKRAALGSGVEEEEGGDDVAEKVAEALLVHLPQSVPRTAVRRGGAARAPNLAGVDGYGYRERAGEGNDVWEGAGYCVSSMVCSEGRFIGRRDRERGCPVCARDRVFDAVSWPQWL
jgi:hypothetical protein